MSADFPRHWNLLALEDAVEAIIDYRGKTPKKTNFGIPLITAKIVKNGRIDTPTEFIAHEDYGSWMTRGFPSLGDIVVTTEAPLGEVAQITNPKVALAQRIVTLRGKKGILNNDYLLCVMQSKFVQDQLEARSSGSTVRGIKQSELRKVLLPIPPEIEQTQIANHVLTLSKKIEINTQTNQTLESIAQAIFKSWFVDFEPVKAKMVVLAEGGTREQAELAAMGAISGKSEAELQQQNTEHYQQLAESAALFPSAMVESELGEIPEGWEVGSIGDIALAKGGYAFKSNEFVATGNKVVKIKNITGDGRVDLTDCDCVKHPQPEKLDRFKIINGDLLMAMTGATVGKIGIAVSGHDYVYLNQRVAKFESKIKTKKVSWFLFPCIQQKSIFDTIVGSAQGSAQPNISSTEIERTEIVVPDENLISKYCELVDPLFKKWMANNILNIELANLRDSLLPKLLSGEIDLSDIQSEVA